MVEARPLAPDELYCLILHHLSGPFRHPYAHCYALPVLFGLASLTSVGEPRKRRGFRPHFSISFGRMSLALLRVPHGCKYPFPSPCATAFPLIVEGRRVSGPLHPVYPPNRTLPAIIVLRYFTKLHHSLYATTCDLGKRPRLGMTLRSSRCQRRFLHIEHESKAPSRRRVGASSARTLLCEPAPSLLIE